MSSDRSLEIAKHFNTRVIDIPAGTFNHGLTRNEGAKLAKAGLIYFTVQDAWISQTDMLEKMVKDFSEKTVMGVMGHQAVPHEKDKNPLLWYRPYSKPGITEKVIADGQDFDKLPVRKQQSLAGWDNVVAMYRKEALTELPFIKTEFAEDWVWSYYALRKGWKLLHDSSLVVYHYHHRSFRYAFNVAYTLNYHFYKFFKYKPTLPGVLMPLARSTYHLLKNKNLSLKERIYWILHNASGNVANYFSTINFLTRLKTGGEKSIERGYNKYCKTIPQGMQKNKTRKLAG
jgi:rhamnosyltransferase